MVKLDSQFLEELGERNPEEIKSIILASTGAARGIHELNERNLENWEARAKVEDNHDPPK